MAQINQTGTFRGEIVDRGIGTSSGGFPQFVLSLRAAEKWDDPEQVWVPWNYEEIEAVAYCVLFGGSGKPTLHANQCVKVFGWDGASFLFLQEDESVSQIQWRMDSHVYNGEPRLQVAWIDNYDADPRRSINKLDKSDIAKLDAQYAAQMKVLGGGPKPKSAKPTVPTQAPPKKRGRPPAPKAEAPPAPPVPPTAAEPVDQETAWKTTFEAASKAKKTQVEVTNTWINATEDAGGEEAVGDDWSGVAAETLKRLGL